MLRVVIFYITQYIVFVCVFFVFVFVCRDVDVCSHDIQNIQHSFHRFQSFFRKTTRTHSPPSLSSIQCLGARKRFKCFLGPRAMVRVGRRCCCYATDSLCCSADIQSLKIRQNFPIRRFAAKLISPPTYSFQISLDMILILLDLRLRIFLLFKPLHTPIYPPSHSDLASTPLIHRTSPKANLRLRSLALRLTRRCPLCEML